MRYLYAVGLLAALYLVLHYFTELSHRQKSAIVAGLLLFIAAAAIYDVRKAEHDAKVRETVLKFQRHQLLHCGDLIVSDDEYTYSDGTQSFIANAGTPQAGIIVSASECR